MDELVPASSRHTHRAIPWALACLSAASLAFGGCGGATPMLSESLVLKGKDGEGFVEVESASGCGDGRVRVGVWGEGWGTPGVVTASVEQSESGLFWLSFPIETGLGEGEGALRLQGTDARVPLGGRAGEHEAVLTATPGPLPADLGAAKIAAFRPRIQAEQAAWALGSFRLEEGGVLVGEVQLRGDEKPWVRVYDHTWLTPRPEWAEVGSDGGDLLLGFAVEPQLAEERGLLRINVARKIAVVPQDRLPTPHDRQLDLVAGTVSPDERESRLVAAVDQALQTEEAWLSEQLPGLAVAALGADGACATPDEVDPAWGLLLRGYEIQIVLERGGCVVGVEPELAQHNRRWKGRIGSDGIIEGGPVFDL
jgi:hypothetical protein